MMDLLPQMVPLLKSMVSSMVCQWFLQSSIIRYQINSNFAPALTTQTSLYIARSPLSIRNIKWFINFYGKPPVATISNARIPTYVCFGLGVNRQGETVFKVDWQTQAEVAQTNQPSDRVYVVGPYNDVMNAWVFKSYGYDTEPQRVEGGFKNNSFPGPIDLDAGDSIDLFMSGIYSITTPTAPLNQGVQGQPQLNVGPYGELLGTLTWTVNRRDSMNTVENETPESSRFVPK